MSSSVLDVVLARAAAGGAGPFDDGARVALCVEGGAMRGVVSAGMVAAVEQLGLLGCFDAVYGSSAGAMNGAYLLAGQAGIGTTIYYENINNRDFIDFARPLRGRPLIDLDFLVDDVMVRRKPLNTRRILDSHVPLVVVATDFETGRRDTFRTFQDDVDLRHALRAGASMPIVSGPPYVFRGRRYLDALLTEPIPVCLAEEDGYTHIVALLTRPSSTTAREVSFAERLTVARPLARLSPQLGELYRSRGSAYTQILNCMASGSGPEGRARVLTIAPAGAEVGKLERRRDALVAGAARGVEAVVKAFTGSNAHVVETAIAYDEHGMRVKPLVKAAPTREVLTQ